MNTHNSPAANSGASPSHKSGMTWPIWAGIIIGLIVIIVLASLTLGGNNEGGEQSGNSRQSQPASERTSPSQEASAPTLQTAPMTVPDPGSVAVPAASAGQTSPAVSIPPGLTICRTVADGYTTEYHNPRYADLTDNHWFPARAGAQTNGERYTSTGDAFDQGFLYVVAGTRCP